MCELGPGVKVVIKGLKARPELNSLTGTITGFSGEERFAVHMPEADTKVALKAANLEATEEDAPKSTCAASCEYIECDACGKAGPVTTCCRCKIAFYCGAQCQRAHWLTHEADCRPSTFSTAFSTSQHYRRHEKITGRHRASGGGSERPCKRSASEHGSRFRRGCPGSACKISQSRSNSR